MDYKVKGSSLTAIADAIRSKTGGADSLTLAQMPTEIEGIKSGGELQEKTVYPSHSEQVIAPDEGYGGLSKVTVGAVPRIPAISPKVKEGYIMYNPVEEAVNLAWETSLAWEVVYTHFLYNGVRLPKIPEDVLAEYPYAWIRNNTTTGYYDLIMSNTPYYYNSSVLYEGAGVEGRPYYRVPISSAESATEWTTYGSHSWSSWGLDTARTVLWSNHDIPNGSADATDIYFEGTDPVPAD